MEIDNKSNRFLEINQEKVNQFSQILGSVDLHPGQDSTIHFSNWTGDKRNLANAYFVLVAICHQTTPIGERRLEGYIGKVKKAGWDYLKDRFLSSADVDRNWCSPLYWQNLTPSELSDLFKDDVTGLTLNRINERTYLINDLGRKLVSDNYLYIDEAFNQHNNSIKGDHGFIYFLDSFEAYKDPLMKKSFLFLDIAMNESDWRPKDPENILSPIDYHELRGHLRIGTIRIVDSSFMEKIRLSLPFNTEEDILLRMTAQEINNKISQELRLPNSVLHYLRWNVFRNCCPRNSDQCHCSSCPSNCSLPDTYKELSIYKNQCIFTAICDSANKTEKLIEPAYIGHFY